MSMKKLGIIVPYRNRNKQLREFSRISKFYLDNLGIPYHVFVVHQDDAKLFNRGALLNIGFKYAEKQKCDYVVFHDVDMAPINVDYSYSDKPLHLATDFEYFNENEKPRETFEEYFGGVTMFTMEDFKKIDGYSNKYWGWGFEDTDLLYRCKKKNIELDILKLKNLKTKCTTLKFNGVNAYVKGKNNFNLKRNNTFFISFYPEKITCDYLKDVDNYSLFSIPGYDFSISFNSFSRYNFCTFDEDKNALYVNSKIITNYQTNLCVTIDYDTHKITVYQDGIKIGDVEFKNIFNYNKEKYFYLGVGDPNRKFIQYVDEQGEKYFKGYIDSFAHWNTVLKESEIYEISNNFETQLTQNYGNYNSSASLKLYYDASKIHHYKLCDLTENGNDGEIVNCEMIKSQFDEYVEVKIPFRRKSLFRIMPHEENGFVGYKWKNQATRWNQLRFLNEVMINDDLLDNDGLSTLEFVEHGVKYINENFTHINIGI